MDTVKKDPTRVTNKLIPISLNDKEQVRPNPLYKKRREQVIIFPPYSDIPVYYRQQPFFCDNSAETCEVTEAGILKNIFNSNFYPRFRYFTDQEFEDPYCHSLAQAKSYASLPVSVLILGKCTNEIYMLAKKISLQWGCIFIDYVTVLEKFMKQFNVELDITNEQMLKRCSEEFLFVNQNKLWKRTLNLLKSKEVIEKGYIMVGFPFGPDFTAEGIIKQCKTLMSIYPPDFVINVMLGKEDYSLAKKYTKTDFGHNYRIDARFIKAFLNLNKPMTHDLPELKINNRSGLLSGVRIVTFNYFDIEMSLMDDQEYIQDVKSSENISEFMKTLKLKTSTKLNRKERLNLLLLKRKFMSFSRKEPSSPLIDAPQEFSTTEYLKSYSEDVHFLLEASHKHLRVLEEEFEKCHYTSKKYDYNINSFQLTMAIDIILRYCDPQSTLRIDGRLPFNMLFDIVQERMACISLSKRPTVTLLMDDYNLNKPNFHDDGIKDEKNDYQYGIFTKPSISPSDVVKSTCMHAWGQRCPVAYKNNEYLAGVMEFAARYHGECYFLSSPEALNLFQQEPNKYLLPLMPAAACKVILCQSNYHELVLVAEAIATFFGAKLINFDELKDKALRNKWHTMEVETELKESEKLLKKMNCGLKSKYKLQECGKLVNVFKWFYDVMKLLHVRLTKYQENSPSTSTEEFETLESDGSHSKSAPIQEAAYNPHEFIANECNASIDYFYPRYLKMTEIIKKQIGNPKPLGAGVKSKIYAKELNELEQKFIKKGLNCFHRTTSCQYLYKDSIKLLQFLPKDYWPAGPPAKITKDSPIFVKEIRAVLLEIRKNLDLSSEEIAEILSTVFREIEQPYRGCSLRYGGWVIYNMPLTMNIWLELLNKACQPFDVLEMVWGSVQENDSSDVINKGHESSSISNLPVFNGSSNDKMQQESFLNTVPKSILKEKLLMCYLLEKSEPQNQEDLDAIPNFSECYKDVIDDRYKIDINVIEDVLEEVLERPPRSDETVCSSPSSDWTLSSLVSEKFENLGEESKNSTNTPNQNSGNVIEFDDVANNENNISSLVGHTIKELKQQGLSDQVRHNFENSIHDLHLKTVISKSAAKKFHCTNGDTFSNSYFDCKEDEALQRPNIHYESDAFFEGNTNGNLEDDLGGKSEKLSSSGEYSVGWQVQLLNKVISPTFSKGGNFQTSFETESNEVKDAESSTPFTISERNLLEKEMSTLFDVTKEIWHCRTVNEYLFEDSPEFEGSDEEWIDEIGTRAPTKQIRLPIPKLFDILRKRNKLHGALYNRVIVYPGSIIYRTLRQALNLIQGGYGSIKHMFSTEKVRGKFKGHSEGEGNSLAPKYPLYNSQYLCPVELHFGKSRLGEIHRHYEYMDEDYYFCSHKCHQLFRMHPNRFSRYQYPVNPPVLRICLVSTPGTGSELLARKIACELDLEYYDLEEIINDNLLPPGCLPVGMVNEHSSSAFDYYPPEIDQDLAVERLQHIRSYLACEENLPSELMDILMKPFRESKKGFIYHRFPHMTNDIEYMIKMEFYPDLIISRKLPIPDLIENLSDIVAYRWRMKLAAITRRLINKDAVAREHWKKSCELHFKKTINQMLIMNKIIDISANNIDYITDFLESLSYSENGLHSDLDYSYCLKKDLSQESESNYRTVPTDSTPVSEEQLMALQYSRTITGTKFSPSSKMMDLTTELKSFPEEELIDSQYYETPMEPTLSPSRETIHKLLNFVKHKSDTEVCPPECHSTPDRNTVLQYNLSRPHFHTELFKNAIDHVRSKHPRPQYEAFGRTVFKVTEGQVRSTLSRGLVRELQILNRLESEAKQCRIPWEDWSTPLINENEIITILKKFKRKPSYFENTFEVDVDDAEAYINEGKYYLSRFGRRCPVQMYEKENPSHQVLDRNEINAVVHKKYIYFLGSTEAKNKFVSDLLTYLQQKSVAPLVILKVLIMGPPCSGKYSLAERLSREYGFAIISCQTAVEYVLKSMSWSHLAKRIKESVESYAEVHPTLIAKAIQAATLTKRASTYGWVLIGVPPSIYILKPLHDCNVIPNFTFIIKIEQNISVKRMKLNIQNLDYETFQSNNIHSKLSTTLLSERYETWNSDMTAVKDLIYSWIKMKWKNLYYLDGNEHMYMMFKTVKESYELVYKIFDNYYKNTNRTDTAIPIGFMNVNETLYNAYKSNFGIHCPVCKSLGLLREVSKPLKRSGNIFQVGESYYWVCSEHILDFVMEPKNSICDITPVEIAFPLLSGENQGSSGICPVCFWDLNFSHQPMKYCYLNYEIKYDSQIYYTCSEVCRKEFEMAPIRFNFPIDEKIIEYWFRARYNDLMQFEGVFPYILPNEEVLWEAIIKAMQKLLKLRPKLPFVSIKNSALIYMAYCLFESNHYGGVFHVQNALLYRNQVEEITLKLKKGLQKIAFRAYPMRNQVFRNIIFGKSLPDVE